MGLTIGSIGSTKNNNITFRDAYLPYTYKGIYLKFRECDASNEECGTISNVLFENVRMDQPTQWPIWIGPAQQSDSRRLCAAHPCSLCWPYVPEAKCDASEGSQYSNIVLRNVTVVKPFSILLFIISFLGFLPTFKGCNVIYS